MTLAAYDKIEVQRLLMYFIKDVRVDTRTREVIVEYERQSLTGKVNGVPSEGDPGKVGSGGKLLPNAKLVHEFGPEIFEPQEPPTEKQ